MTSLMPVFLLWLLACNLCAADTYRLSIGEKTINLTGKNQQAVLANGSLPAPTLHWHEGEQVTLLVTNTLKEPTSLHWHGIILPYQMDGVPGISFDGIAPGETFTYQFKVQQNGTYWYHGHSGMQEQMGLYGALIIDPPHEHNPPERDYAIILSDWPEADPHRTLARLKKQSDYYNFQKRTLSDFFQDIRQLGFAKTLADRLAWGEMRMDPTDWADVTGATYHFLINGRTPAMDWTALFNAGEKVRLRFINASAMTHFDIRVPGLKMRMTAADGQMVKPVDVDEFRIAVAETYDVLVEPKPDRAYSIFAEAMDRSGYASATLTPRIGLKAAIPALRPRVLLTLDDMGAMHSGHGDKADKAAGHAHHAGHNPAAADNPHAAHGHEMTMTGIESYPALSYQQLRAAQPNADWMPPDREITLRLTGNMKRYIWSFDDVKYADAEPIKVRYGEHLRFHYVNETMMNHPIHIHGLWQYLDNGNGAYNPKKHVINVKPGATVDVDVFADAEGEWAFHCHLLYHMDTGMFRKFVVEKTGQQP